MPNFCAGEFNTIRFYIVRCLWSRFKMQAQGNWKKLLMFYQQAFIIECKHSNHRTVKFQLYDDSSFQQARSDSKMK